MNLQWERKFYSLSEDSNLVTETHVGDLNQWFPMCEINVSAKRESSRYKIISPDLNTIELQNAVIIKEWLENFDLFYDFSSYIILFEI